MENYQFITHLQQFPERTSKIYIYFSGFPVEKYIEKKVVLIMKSLILWDISVEKLYKKILSILGKREERDSMVGNVMRLTIINFIETFQQKWGRKKFSNSGKQSYQS